MPATITSCVDPVYMYTSPMKVRTIYTHLAIFDAALSPVLYMATMPQFKPRWWLRKVNPKGENRTFNPSKTGSTVAQPLK